MKHPTLENGLIQYALIAAILMTSLSLALYLTFEPNVAKGQQTEEFTVTQEITGEISFETSPNDITLLPAIPGLTGGAATGSTYVEVSTNNPAGYTLAINFATTTAMQQNDGTAEIPNLGNTLATADYDMSSVGVGSAAFALTASSASVVSDLLDDGGGCGSGSPSTDTCWVMPSDASGQITIVDRSSETSSAGERTDLAFQVVVGENPDPTLPIAFYKATATLTATEK